MISFVTFFMIASIATIQVMCDTLKSISYKYARIQTDYS